MGQINCACWNKAITILFNSSLISITFFFISSYDISPVLWEINKIIRTTKIMIYFYWQFRKFLWSLNIFQLWIMSNYKISNFFICIWNIIFDHSPWYKSVMTNKDCIIIEKMVVDSKTIHKSPILGIKPNIWKSPQFWKESTLAEINWYCIIPYGCIA